MMIGKDFWDDMEIDSVEIQNNIDIIAQQLIDHHGPKIKESDLLKMNAYSDSSNNPIQSAIVKASLDYYVKQDYHPEWIHSDMIGRTEEKKSLFKRMLFWK